MIDNKVNVAINELMRVIATEMGDKIESIRVYGSVVRDEYQYPDSDVDLFVVSKDRSITPRIIELGVRVGGKHNVFFSPIIRTSEEVEALQKLQSPFIKSVFKEGKIVYDHS